MASPEPSCLPPNLKPGLGACLGGGLAWWVTVGSWERLMGGGTCHQEIGMCVHACLCL